MSRKTNDAQSMALAAWHLRGLLDECLYGKDRDNPPLTIRAADGELLHLRQDGDGRSVMVDDQTGIITTIDPEDMEGSIICALRAADERAVSRLRKRLHEVADAHERAGRTNRGLVLYSRMGARLCDWSASSDGEHGVLQVRCEPVYGRYTSKVRGWRVSSGGSLDDWLTALAAELDEPR